MKRLLSIVVAFVVVAHAPGEAQRQAGPPFSSFGPAFSSFANEGETLCSSWRTRFTGRPNSSEFFLEAMRHAWAYGFVVGAAYTSQERLPRVDSQTVSDWLEAYCAEHPRARIADGAAALIDHLVSRPPR